MGRKGEEMAKIKVVVVLSEHDQKFHPQVGVAFFIPPSGKTSGKIRGEDNTFEVQFNSIYKLVTVGSYPVREYTVRVIGPTSELVDVYGNNRQTRVSVFKSKLKEYEVDFLN